ncbi:hypothetical protein L6452_13487 [Arctium lappa]|uniref:Uncharacterized protein n=1 Tax=Arctium lappa TaxID=4217 RepID=A0ACB9CI90_ARCLA|nr:hypothetical protein L6452_13487 [Arctium lappa]
MLRKKILLLKYLFCHEILNLNRFLLKFAYSGAFNTGGISCASQIQTNLFLYVYQQSGLNLRLLIGGYFIIIIIFKGELVFSDVLLDEVHKTHKGLRNRC